MSDCKCPSCGADLLLVTDLAASSALPTIDEIEADKPWVAGIELSTRAYNCLTGRWGQQPHLRPYTPAKVILSIKQPQFMRNFGKHTFTDIVCSMFRAGFTEVEIKASDFFRTAPKPWQESIQWRE